MFGDCCIGDDGVMYLIGFVGFENFGVYIKDFG